MMTAPYTFIPFTPPLPSVALDVDRSSARHDRPVTGRLSGHIDLTITALSPVFIGSAEREERHLTLGGHPAIPGSTLKGLLRSTLGSMIGTNIGSQPEGQKHFWYRNPVEPRVNRRTDTAFERADKARIAALAQRYHKRRDGQGAPGRQRIGLLVAREDGRYEVIESARLRLKLPEHVRSSHTTHYASIPKVRRAVLSRDLGIGTFEASNETLRHINDRLIHVVWAAVWARGADFKQRNDWVARPRTMRCVPYAVGSTAKHAQQNALARLRTDRTNESVPADCIAAETAFDSFLDEYGFEDGRTGNPDTAEMVLHATGLVHDGNTSTVHAYLFSIPGTYADDWIADTWIADETKANKGNSQRRDTLRVPPEVVRTLDDPDQLTEYQNALPDWKQLADMHGAGAEGLPVFFDTATHDVSGRTVEEVVRIGRAGGFRIPASGTVLQTVPPYVHHRPGKLADEGADAVQALFGDVDGTDAIAARVHCGHALSDFGSATELSRAAIPLLSPKIQAWHTRLRQPASDTPSGQVTYDIEGDMSYRGREVYLHRWDQPASAGLEAHASEWTKAVTAHAEIAPEGATNTGESTDTTIRPVAPGTVYTGRITFVNLTSAELGALLTAITLANPASTGSPEPVRAHKVGAAKPLGLGSVHLVPQLFLRGTRRYRWTDQSDMPAPNPADHSVYVEAFREALRIHHGGDSNWVSAADHEKWPATIAAVFRAAQWAQRPPRHATREMTVKEHAARRVPRPLETLPFTGPPIHQPPAVSSPPTSSAKPTPATAPRKVPTKAHRPKPGDRRRR
nr:RAMP superfamily CRISPR-associated protein [uncultured Rhodococcus sp.]